MLPSRALFARSVWKGPNLLPLPITRVAPGERVPPIRTQARSATILPNFVGMVFQVHNGKVYHDVRITEDMVGHKLGEFSPFVASRFSPLVMTAPDVIQRQTRRVYSTDQLHRLRGTVSTPKLNESIEEHDGNEADLIKGRHDLSPHGFQQHKIWVDTLVQSPSRPCICQGSQNVLTLLESPTEHVLRGSKSFAARSWKSRASDHSLRISSNKENRAAHLPDPERPSFSQHASALAPILGEIAANNQQIVRTGPYGRTRRSPTPSLKRKKVEAIVRAHGSPTHVRVTAGGRIVPSEQSPLCHPRYGYSAIKTNGGLIKFAPNHPMGKSQWTQATQNGFVAQDADGRLCQIVDGTILPLKEIEGALQLYMPAPNLNVTQRTSSIIAASQSHGLQGGVETPMTLPSGDPIMPKPSVQAQINALELEYCKLDRELKDVDKTEVMHGRTMGKMAKDALISKRRELVTTLDNVRKAMKSLKQQNLATDAPTPSRTLHNKHTSSPVFNRLPPSLQPRQSNQEVPPQLAAPSAVHGHFLGQPAALVGPYGFGPTPSPEAGYGAMSWAMPPPAMFAPPPIFDGSGSGIPLSMPPTYTGTNLVYDGLQPAPASNDDLNPAYSHPSQSVGATASRSSQEIASRPQMRATSIQIPEQKSAQPSRSNLNPMSPEYKPLCTSPKKLATPVNEQSDAILDKTSPIPSQLIQVVKVPDRSPPMSVERLQETNAPAKREAHLQSSSVSSFETADFFPCNTQEYSTRQHNADLHAAGHIKNTKLSPRSSPEMECASQQNRESHVADNVSYKSPPGNVPAAPPGTPVERDGTGYPAPLPVIVDSASWNQQSHVLEAPRHRDLHNVSPKAKRSEWRFVEEHPDREQTTHSSSPAKQYACTDELCVNNSPQDTLDFSQKSREWIEGYQAGLNRCPVGSSRMGELLDGYCSGLLKSSPSCIGHSTGSPVKPAPRRPSPVPYHSQSSAGGPFSGRLQSTVRPTLSPLGDTTGSLHAFKQAVLAPHNENAILTPAADGPHVNETKCNLGAWAKERAMSPSLNKPLPLVVLSTDLCEHDDTTLAVSRGNNSIQSQPSSKESVPQPCSLSIPSKRLASSSLSTNGVEPHRVNSFTSMESKFYRQWPGSRVVDPHLEWKSGSSVSHHTGLATGLFAHAQFDGKNDFL
nr:37s ribosomal protein s19, mitochondrial [Quercus suber]